MPKTKLKWRVVIRGIESTEACACISAYEIEENDGLFTAVTTDDEGEIDRHIALLPMPEAMAACEYHCEHGSWPALIVGGGID
jgi:hypothetical protein